MSPRAPRATFWIAAFAALVPLLPACSAPTSPGATGGPGGVSGAPGSGTDAAGSPPTALVLADAQELGGYNPVRGYAELGVSPLYDGLLRLAAEDDRTLPRLEPALAAAAPTPDATSTTWRVKVRPGVKFHDDSTFGPEDVVATYQAILDPASGSDIASSLDMVRSVSAAGDEVVFALKYPYVDFPARLLIGIAPSEKLTGGGLAANSSLNTAPVGTGPYRLAELTPDRAVFTANPSYWDGAPQVEKVTTVYVPDDNSRAQQMTAGEIDGTSLPPLLAKTLEGKEGVRIDSAQSADWRGVMLPRDSAFAQDADARMAMNLAVDRQAMLTAVLGGKGRVAATPVASVYGAAYDEGATFPHDPTRAEELLDRAGWALGTDGVRRKGTQLARFTVAYRPTDTLRRDLATAFAADMKKIGVDVNLEGLDFAAIEPRVADLGILLGGGDKPYSLDTQVYGPLHTNVPGSSPWDNPGGFGSAGLDAALDKARRSADEGVRVASYRTVQRDYLKDPTSVFLVFLDHTYVSKDDDWQRGNLVVEPHAHGIGWGPWWNVQSWRR